MEDPAIREMAEYMEANKEEIWEKLPGNRQVTLLVFREGDQLNFFRVVDRGDGTLTPLSESLRYCIMFTFTFAFTFLQGSLKHHFSSTGIDSNFLCRHRVQNLSPIWRFTEPMLIWLFTIDLMEIYTEP